MKTSCTPETLSISMLWRQGWLRAETKPAFKEKYNTRQPKTKSQVCIVSEPKTKQYSKWFIIIIRTRVNNGNNGNEIIIHKTHKTHNTHNTESREIARSELKSNHTWNCREMKKGIDGREERIVWIDEHKNSRRREIWEEKIVGCRKNREREEKNREKLFLIDFFPNSLNPRN